MSLSKVLTAAAAIIVASSAASAAQTPNRMNQFNAWGTYSYQSDGSRVCYVLSTPTAMQPSTVNHGDIFFLVSQKPGQNAYEPQVVMGYPLREGSQVTVDVDGRKFSLFTRGESAWVEDASQEPALVAAMRNGRAMTVSAVSQRGTNTTYTYSLAGVTAAMQSIGNCS
ncbi:invasion associated locus B family protein [Aureimonas populi]|uniref:Invasion associated locus B family protein n=1 Tax=Aureimonas populi TaxID=1701758 RepID=A0ABW5CPI3_9HYPH|nr:invasion associated locus B family protein [Aureimonas populi]